MPWDDSNLKPAARTVMAAMPLAGEGGPNIIDQIDSRTQSELADISAHWASRAAACPLSIYPLQEMTALTAYARTLVPVPSGDPPPEVRKKIQTTDGQTLQGRVLNEGMTDLQMAPTTAAFICCAKADGDRYRQVTSQTDWPTYHGDPSGNRYTQAHADR